MAGKIMNKIMDVFCLNDDLDDIEDEFTNEELDEREIDKDKDKDIDSMEFVSNNSSKKSKVVNLPINGKNNLPKQKVVIIKPLDFEEAANICDNLKNNKIVVVNTTALDTKVGQRLLDFVGGATYVLGVQIREVEKGIYIFMPSNVEISNTLRDDLQSKGVFSFIK